MILTGNPDPPILDIAIVPDRARVGGLSAQDGDMPARRGIVNLGDEDFEPRVAQKSDARVGRVAAVEEVDSKHLIGELPSAAADGKKERSARRQPPVKALEQRPMMHPGD